MTHAVEIQSIMEEVSLRFPDLIEQILEKVNTKKLYKCRKVNIPWSNMIDNSKEIWIRRIAMRTKCSKTLLKKFSREKTKDDLAAFLIQKLCIGKDYPMHFAADIGDMEMFSIIFESGQKKNPKGDKILVY